ncbi:MAG: hypothetical protein Q9159_004653 [Coniocarpon cinnabarinum]
MAESAPVIKVNDENPQDSLAVVKEAQPDAAQSADNTFQVTVQLPHPPYKTQTIVSTQDQAQDIRQSITDAVHTFQYSCFHLEVSGRRIPEFVDLSQVEGIKPDAQLTLVEDPYTEKDARLHVLRVRELVGAISDRTDVVHGIQAGLTLHDDVAKPQPAAQPNGSTHALSDCDLASPPKFDTLLQPQHDPPPKPVSSISVSPWNPPPYHLRSRGHLLYIHIVTLEGEHFHVTAHVTGFYVNKSTTGKFDPTPRTVPKASSAHSLLTLLSKISPGFDGTFKSLQVVNGPSSKDPLSSFPLSNALPANPWIISPSVTKASEHQPDITRTQESFLVNGADNAETLRDWNEEFQTTRELPKETVQDRVFRERVTSKLFADYNEAAALGAILIARGEVAPLNPTEPPDAQIFVYNNVFYSFGADGVGTFASEGGDEAARVATGKDVMGVKTVNQLDVQDLAAPGTAVIDYLGKRIVAQSIVPGIFKQREPGEQQIDYGGVEGKEVVAKNDTFAPLFEKMSKALRVKKHPVWDKNGERYDLESSIETKGLLGTDGRRYVLDLYRITPVDVHWIHTYCENSAQSEGTTANEYPHKMCVLRPELIEGYWRMKLAEYVKTEVAKRSGPGTAEAPVDSDVSTRTEVQQSSDEDKQQEQSKAKEQDPVDVSGFHFALNPDVFCGQQPQTLEEKESWAEDEKDVRAVSDWLLNEVIPRLIQDLNEGEVGFPMDGQSLSSALHKRGINIRYLGVIAQLLDRTDHRRQALKALVEQEMISRSFKHVASYYLRSTPAPLASSCIAHLLNCLLGWNVSQHPTVEIDLNTKALYACEALEFESVTPASLQTEVSGQVSLRYRYQLNKAWVERMKPIQMLREVSLKLGLQLAAREFIFQPRELTPNGELQDGVTNGGLSPSANGHASNSGKKKKKGSSPNRQIAQQSSTSNQTFHVDDIYNIVPVIKEAAPRSVLAEEAFEAGRISVAQNQRELGQELLLESLSLHEQIYGILHAEVARAYYQLSSLFYGLDDKAIAVELARKAVIVSERTLGIDSHETLLAYLNLGLFEHAAGNSMLALTYVRHALDVWKIIYGPSHPDSITTLNNAAVMLQHLKLYRDSRIWFEASLVTSQRVSGPQSVNTATLLFQLAQALALDQDSKGAVARMREAYNIFHSQLGPSDRNTKEAETWLENLTQNAVSIAKHAKDVQARRFRRFNYLSPGVTLGTRPQPPSSQLHPPASNAAVSGARLDERSVDELMKYIEGGEGAKQTTPKKRPAHPRRRR